MEPFIIENPDYTSNTWKVLWSERLLCKLARVLRPLASEPLVIQGRTDFSDVPKPRLYIAKHESHRDNFTAFAFNDLAARTEPIRVMVREVYGKIPLVKNVGFTVKRTRYDHFDSEEAKRETRAMNQKKIEDVLLSVAREGANVGAFPEGTTKNDGTLGHLGRGAYILSKIGDKGLTCICIGNTEDRLAARPLLGIPRIQSFYAMGEPFILDHPTLEEFNEYVRTQFASLNTLTTSQIAGNFIYRLLDDGVDEFTLFDVANAIQKGVHHARLNALLYDPGLDRGPVLIERAQRFCDAIESKGYAHLHGDTYELNGDRMWERPEPEVFKHENPLLYHVNRIRSCAKYVPELESLL